MIPTLNRYLNELRIIVDRRNTRNAERVWKFLPMRICSNFTPNCNDMMFNETREYTTLLGLIEDNLEHWLKLNTSLMDGTEFPQALKDSLWARYNNTDFIISCISEFHKIIEKGHEAILKLYGEVDEAVKNNALFSSTSFHETVRPELDWIMAKSNLLRIILTDYSRNSIDKHDMVKIMQKEGHFTHLLKIKLNTILSKLNTDIMIKLQFQSGGLKNNVHRWVQSLLKIASSMVKYYDDDFIENKTRMMKIWEKPHPLGRGCFRNTTRKRNLAHMALEFEPGRIFITESLANDCSDHEISY